jgi:ABC-type sugar transport system permease subunit
MAWNLGLSFFDWAPTRRALFIGLEHYEELLFYDPVFWVALRNTLLYMAAMPVAIGAALGLALLVNQKIRAQGAYRTVLFLSYPLMPVAVGVVWRWLYDEKVGLINYALLSSGLVSEPIAFLESSILALPAVVAAGMWQLLGFFMVILLTGLQTIPRHLYEAAAIDGAGPARMFFRITLPLLRPSLFICFVIGIVSSFTSFDLVYVMTGGGPGHATELLITYVYKTAFRLTKFDYAAALTVVMFVVFLALALIANRLSGGDAGRVKGSAA